MANTAVSLIDLDFDTLKENYKTYMRSQARFQDVDFDGSNISVLIDLLAYNTYINSFYMNMMSTEMFLDTAQSRDSVVSHAKSLNYIPRSFRSSRANIDITVTPTNSPNTVILPKGLSFTSKVGANTFTFTLPENRILTSTNNTFVAANVAIYEGPFTSDVFVMDYSETTQRFVLTDPAIDTSSLFVTILEDDATDPLEYTVGTSLFGLIGTSQVCFLQAAESQKYELVFSSGDLGRRPKNGAVITATYRTSAGELPNGASVFSVDTAIDGHTNVIINTVQSATGGLTTEGIESIRFNAPKYFQSQERAVTTADYKSLLFNTYPEITSVNVYGGEDAEPPRFGKVLVSVDVQDADGVPEYKKNEYLQYLRDRCSLSIDPVIIDPDFMYVDVRSNVRYNINSTTLSQQEIELAAKTAIINYSTQYLDDFSVTLRGSQLSSAIDNADSSVLSNDLIVRPYITYVPTVNADNKITIAFKNSIRRLAERNSTHLYVDEQSVTSSTFTFEGTDGISFEDNGSGALRLVKLTPTSHTIIREDVGTVDYTTGTIVVPSLTVSEYAGDGIQFYIVPEQKDVTATQNKIMKIKASDIYITITPERL